MFCRTDIPEEDLIPILQNIPSYSSKTPGPSSVPAAEVKAPVVTSITADEEKKIRNLRKKLDQIDKLKAKQASGEQLEKNQVMHGKLFIQMKRDKTVPCERISKEMHSYLFK